MTIILPMFKNKKQSKQNDDKKKQNKGQSIFEEWAEVLNKVNEDRSNDYKQKNISKIKEDKVVEKKTITFEDKTKEKIKNTKNKEIKEEEKKFDLEKAIIYSSIIERPYK